MLAACPAKRRSVSDAAVLHASRQFASHLDWREPIGLQERLEGRSAHNGEFLCDVLFPLSGSQVKIVTRDVSKLVGFE